MPRSPRFIPPDSLQHVSDVIAQNRFLLTPSQDLNERFLGVLGRAQKAYGMSICAVVVMANHYHLLLRPRDGKQLADFMCLLKTNLAKEIGRRLQGWSSHFFDQRYHAITVSDEEAAQIGVLRYILSHGVKEFLVDTVQDWPGIHCASSLISGTPLQGLWFDRSAERAARQQGGVDTLSSEAFVSRQTITFSPLPCWQHLPESTWRQHVANIVDAIDEEGATERKLQGKRSLGKAKVLAQDPHSRPDEVSKSPQPRFHAASREVFEAMLDVWRQVLKSYRAASERLRAGDRSAVFPEGTFPPRLPFVPFGRGSMGVLGVLSARGQPG